MIVRFSNTFDLPIDHVFSYFRSPADWVRLYGIAGDVIPYPDGWIGVPLHRFPFPLIAKNTDLIANEVVRWTFRGFWKGQGEVRFTQTDQGVLVQGYEQISARWLFFLSPIVEALFLRRQFEAIWELGWRRLRKQEIRPVP